MNNMIEIKLGKLCEITSSKRIFASEYVEDGILFCRSKEIIEMANNKKITEPLYISKERFDEIKNKFGVPQNGDLLLTSVGTLGVPYVVKENDCFYFKDGNLTWMKNFSNKLNSKYLYYWLFSDFGKAPLLACAIGSSQGAITIDILNRFKIACPDRKIQDVIVSVLSRYDELIEINNKRIKLLEQAAEELYKEWFVRFRFPNYQSAEFENEKPNGWHFGDESNMKRPKGWEYTKFKKLGLFKRGKNITASEMVEGNIPVISAGIEPSGYHNKPNVYGDSLTISASGANAGLLKYNLKNIWAADCLYYQDDELLWYVYNTLKFLQPVITNMQCGAAQPHVYPKNISKLCIIIPPKSLIKKFCNIVTPFYNEIKQLNQKNEILIKQRDLLLPRLMSGKLSVETKKGSVPKVKKIISFDKFCSNIGMAARAKFISDEDLRAMYEAYIDDDATE